MFDQIGTIAILNPKKASDLKTKNLKQIKNLAQKILAQNKHLKTVLLKKEKIKGRFRKASYLFLAGKKTFETLYKEHQAIFKLNIKKVYFNPRLSSNRKWVAEKIISLIEQKKVKKNPKILVAFSGIGIYGIIIAKFLIKKRLNYQKIVLIEINKSANFYAYQNIKLNKLEKFKIIEGDVKNILPKLKEKFDLILACRPNLKYDFLKEILSPAQKGTFIFYFDFLKEESLNQIEVQLKTKAEKFKKKIKILEIKKAGEIGPKNLRIVILFQII